MWVHRRGVRAAKVHGDWAASCSKDSLHLWSMQTVLDSLPTPGSEPAQIEVRETSSQAQSTSPTQAPSQAVSGDPAKLLAATQPSC